MDTIEFAKLEKAIYDFVCEYARNITVSILKDIDQDLMIRRDSSRYRLKDSVKTSIKTLYGEVEYKRRYYYDNVENKYIFLLDENMGMNKVGLFSENMIKLIVNECINESYRKAAEDISRATAQSISSVGAWKIVQQLGQNIEREEDLLIADMDRGIHQGDRITNVLFQEADGVWLNMQGINKERIPKQELKIATIYEGCKNTKRHELVNKKVIAGMEAGSKFMKRREAYVRSIYNYDFIPINLLNSDGTLWIKGDEQITYQQLDQFHIFQEITRRVPEKNIRNLIVERFKNKDIINMLDVIQTYLLCLYF